MNARVPATPRQIEFKFIKMLIGIYIVVNNIIDFVTRLFIFHSGNSFLYSTVMGTTGVGHNIFLISGIEVPFLPVKSVQSMVFVRRIRADS